MIVVDASAMVELVLQTDLGSRVEARLFRNDDELHAPHLLDIEVLQALRRIVQAGDVGADRALQSIEDLTAVALHRHDHEGLATRIWELRGNLSAHDAAYVALAEALPATLVTCDRKLGGAPAHAAQVEVIR
jgi:predicted nucleic acid-binding protein